MSESLKWVKAKASGGSGGSCVEIGTDGQIPIVRVRDTKSRERGMLTVTTAAWGALMADAKAGRLDLGAQVLAPDMLSAPPSVRIARRSALRAYWSLIPVMSR
jgi:hypothetical protein